MPRLHCLSTFAFVALALVAGCRKQVVQASYDNTAEKQAFFVRYNKQVAAQLAEDTTKLEKELADPSVLPPVESEPMPREEKERQLAMLKHHAERPDYFEFFSEEDLPSALTWQTNLDDPDVGSPNAKKGGALRNYFTGLSFPPTIRSLGKEANNDFRSEHWDNIEMGLINTHPNTKKSIPALADRWAIGADGQEVYFHIDPEARWSDGKKVTTRDFVTLFYIALSPYLTEAYYRAYYGEQFWGISTYGDDYLCVRLASAKPRAEFFANLLPFQEDFYREFGPDFEVRYNWRTRPTTGAYQILPEDIEKGRSITFSRVKNWWARDRLYTRNLFNPDRIQYVLVRDQEKAFEMFRLGELDLFPLGLPKYWYEKTEIPEVFKGYIEKAEFYNEYPRIPRGLYYNFANPLLANRDLRVGVCHATNWQKVIDFDLRGDAERLNIFSAGYGEFSNPNVRAREFSVEKARESFAKAGFTTVGPDGILMDASGKRLSLTITYTRADVFDQWMQRLKEEAKKAGLEFQLDSLDNTASFKKVMNKNHEIAFWGWGITPPYPEYYEILHSKDAFLPGTHQPRPMTNNISTYGNPVMDGLVSGVRAARSEAEIKNLCWQIEEIIHEDALWAPGFQKSYYREGYWRWVCWPDDFNCRVSELPESLSVFWIDEDKKRETLEARRTGKAFPEVSRVYDKYRVRSTEVTK
jgi:microcin C transport system substrate-binding protein